jgi:chromosome segregation ATPase
VTATLFDLTGEALKLQRTINDSAELLFSDDPFEVLDASATLEALISAETDNRRQVEAKADAWCWVIDSLRAQAAARGAHAQRLKDLAVAAEQQANALQERLIEALQKIDPDLTKLDLPEHKITSRRSQAVEVTAEVAELPIHYVTARTTYSATKTALAAALKGGEQIEGVALVERRSWKIA